MSLKTESLAYTNIPSLYYENIAEVAVRHGFDPNLADDFKDFIAEMFEAYREERRWLQHMGDDL